MRWNRRGFTLMELVVASVLLGLTVMGITAFGGVSKGAATTGRETEATLYAQQLTDLLRHEVRYNDSGFQSTKVCGNLPVPGVVICPGVLMGNPNPTSLVSSQLWLPAAAPFNPTLHTYPDPDGSGGSAGDGLPTNDTVLDTMPCAVDPTGIAGCPNANTRRWYVVTDYTINSSTGAASVTNWGAGQVPDLKKVEVRLRWDE